MVTEFWLILLLEFLEFPTLKPRMQASLQQHIESPAKGAVSSGYRADSLASKPGSSMHTYLLKMWNQSSAVHLRSGKEASQDQEAKIAQY